MTGRSGVEAAIFARLEQWLTATFEGDPAGQAEIEHPEAIFTYPAGTRYTTREHIKLTGRADKVDEHDITHFEVRPFGDDLAISYVDHTLRATLKDDPFGDPDLIAQMRSGILFAMSVTWKKFGDDWRIVSMNAHVVKDGFVPREQRRTPNVITYPSIDVDPGSNGFGKAGSDASMTLLDKVKIQAEVLAPLHGELVALLGKSQADDVVRRALSPWAKSFGREIAQSFSGTGLQKIKTSVAALADQGLQEVEFIRETDDELIFHMKGCRAAEFYKAAGIAELGGIFLCEIDFQATKEIDPELELERPQTLMAGGDFCDFRIRRKKAAAVAAGSEAASASPAAAVQAQLRP